ncbi:tRNA (adenosine(37)-N6)-dimethylallyltransferase MiaA [Mucilaginibacter rubeus]|uniref:tRNA dimethylallyltransferase n=2 Tax=Mucilaginibacter rubeus TaxID=2027860 RepID=A0AAE6MMC1_9SPHI|nr:MULTISPECIES: tRNA (adenosine(37)-N6)-dimethylallyltransferase MiaA [Mucilaginibacter]QEM08137.1 tRNA (adenosine(37)-N6)-dimethylallyltransferase MiaA [Mucilaginibacter rubeus]QEM14694.1 tRNA (adenosine(37)-N6)-dimethylallyltransferase MiaA [Mucilaginibacter gossypii]QTE42599.1 tRNA (adenosine(37)-N6)-dimethylallyltransferase MiaA [Mucilaginibacter rubeus]QTE49200.1 tRNA (adenosine(37)-N6)-dimethylallyltransferase MiaA [Mucilaginibacter rubeus]QTE60255.1 tRNA (adenosine(37)-N6)-dimethylally
MTQANKTLIVVAGPTAVGKTAAAIKLAQQFNTVVVSADSRQFFREMSIGTAKPDESELATAKHYFINSHSITESFSVGDFEKQGLALLDELFKVHDKVILAGGSGLYIKAICEGFDDLPVANNSVREKLNQQLEREGITTLQKQLQQVDPDYYTQVDLNNPQRIIRALEVFETSGKPFSSYRNATVNKRPFNIIKLALDMPRGKLYERINLRVDLMVKQGLIQEVKSLLPYRELNALNTVGYSELFDYFDGKTSLDEALLLIKQNTRRFAKRQLTWFRKDKDFVWFDAGAPDVIDQMLKAIETSA